MVMVIRVVEYLMCVGLKDLVFQTIVSIIIF